MSEILYIFCLDLILNIETIEADKHFHAVAEQFINNALITVTMVDKIQTVWTND